MGLPASYGRELEIACLAVQKASILTKTLLKAVDKGHLDKVDSTPVTIADFAVQALIISAIHHVFPQDGFVGEEDSRALREDTTDLLDRTWHLVSTTRLEDATSESQLYTPKTKEEMLETIDLGTVGRCGPTGRTWVLDPVDGTATFLQGQQYAVCLALIEDGRQRVAVLGCPNLPLASLHTVSEDIVDQDGYGCMLSAVAGQGVFIRTMSRDALQPARPIAPLSAINSLHDLRFVDCARLNSSDYALHGRVAAHIGAPWPALADLWSAQMRYVALAVGCCNAFIKVPREKGYRSYIWDHAGGMLLAEEVGCLVTDLEGNPVDLTLGRRLAGCYGMVVAPASIHAQLVKAIRVVQTEASM